MPDRAICKKKSNTINLRNVISKHSVHVWAWPHRKKPNWSESPMQGQKFGVNDLFVYATFTLIYIDVNNKPSASLYNLLFTLIIIHQKCLWLLLLHFSALTIENFTITTITSPTYISYHINGYRETNCFLCLIMVHPIMWSTMF